MTTTEAIDLTRSRAEGRTRYEGQEPRVDELLLGEIERLGRAVDAMERTYRHERAGFGNRSKEWDALTEERIAAARGTP